MATINVAGRFRAQPARHDRSTTLRALWKAGLRRLEERRSLTEISRLGPRLTTEGNRLG